jgi:hypothetical protein
MWDTGFVQDGSAIWIWENRSRSNNSKFFRVADGNHRVSAIQQIIKDCEDFMKNPTMKKIYPQMNSKNCEMMLKSLSIVEIKEIPKMWTAEDIIFLCNLRNGQNQAAVQ